MFKEYTDQNMMQILATTSRRTDISVFELEQSHVEIGRYLAYHLVNDIEIENVEIQHVQGVKLGKRIKEEKEILFLVFLRAGLYIAEGFRSVFKNSPFIMVSPQRSIGLSQDELEEIEQIEAKKIVILDSVINTGKTLFAVLNQLQSQLSSKIIVSSLVTPETTAKILKDDFDPIDFYIGRVSTNQYVGKGKTDTGNRLFGTLGGN